METDVFTRSDHNIPFVTKWTAVWYYTGNVRRSLLRYKFYNARSYSQPYGRFLAVQLLKEGFLDVDLITWVPIGRKRLRKRGYDQVALLAESMGKEVNMVPAATLEKARDTKPQSSIGDSAKRRANILGTYRVSTPELVKGKRILLLDDIITTGATASECAKMLLMAGAKEVLCAAIAAAPHNKKKKCR